jgi:hypothetical protein
LESARLDARAASRAKGVAFIHGAAIKEIAGDAAIGVQPALNFARWERSWNGG